MTLLYSNAGNIYLDAVKVKIEPFDGDSGTVRSVIDKLGIS